MAYVALCKALYDYVAQAEDELNLAEDDYLYILESDDPEWWKAKLRRLDENGLPIQDDAEEGVVGLVPANYVEEAEPVRLSRALYDYQAQTEDELSMAEDELLRVYESDGVWLLVKKQGNDPLSGGEGRLGYVPANYVDEAGAVDTGAAPVAEQHNEQAEEEDEEEDDADASVANPAAIPQINLPQTANLGKGDEIKMWSVSALDSKKKKKKGTLGIGNASLFFASESDKTPVQKISVLHITNYTLEKSKTLHIDLSSEAGLSESSLDFHTGSKEAANEIVKKIEASKANALTASTTVPGPAASSSVVQAPPSAPAPPAVPPAPAPPASTSILPPPTRTAASILPPPIRKSVSFQPEQQLESQPAAASTTGEEEHAIALYDFDAQGDDELSVAENEHLVIIEKENDDWWKARNDSGQEGVVPASYVEASDTASAAADGSDEVAAAAATAAAAAAAAAAEQEQRELEEAEAAAVAAAERQRKAAEIAERRRREAADRREREEKERTRRDLLKAQPAPAPPKLTQRPSTTEVTRAAKNVSIPQGRTAPERPRDGGGRSKPSPNNTRMWTDRTAQFKVEAEFLGFNQGKIRLHKMNGVVIEVAVEKMSDADIQFLEDITGKKLMPTQDEMAASASKRRESSRPQSSGQYASREDRERERERRKEKEREQRRREQARSGPKRNVDWFEFFLAAGVDVDECTRYASAFERDKIDETVLGDLETSTLRSMGLREGDIIRVTKFIDRKYRRDKTHSSSRSSGKANANTAALLEKQLKADEEMARQLQEQESAARRGETVSPAPPQLFSGPDGTLKNNTRRGRPIPKTAGASNVDTASLAAASESLARSNTATPPIHADTISPAAAPKRTGSSLANGFDDDAWTPRPPSTKPATPATPATPARPTVASPAPAASAASTAPAAAAISSPPAPATPAADPTSALFEKLAAMRPPSASASPRPGASPSPATSFMGQNQSFNPHAPRGPFAPVAANQGLLQPLVPTQGTGQFVPTKLHAQPTGMMGMQMTGVQPQQTGWGMPNMQGMQHPQMTGYSPQLGSMNSMGGMGQMGVTGLPAQATGYGGGFGGSGISPSPSPFGGQVHPQTTGFVGLQPQPTGFGQLGQNPQQMLAQQTGFGLASQQPQQPLQPQDDKEKFNASNIFQQMKSGQFAKDPNAAPQSSNKYDALRPQPTGFQPGGVMPQYTGINLGQQQQQQQGGYGGYGGY